MKFPEKLKKGDTIAIVAPSSPVKKEEADGCKKLIEDMGYKVKMGECTYLSLNGYKAGTGEQRAKDINMMFADKDVKGVFCIRGGDTSSHVIDKIDLEIVRSNPKIFVGYSDVTSLHILFNQKADLATFHGPMVKSNMLKDYDDFTRMSFEKAINMDEVLYLDNPEGEEFKVISEGRAEGVVVGGNLALITSMIGTPYEIDTKGKILFFEDIYENVTRVDRMLYQLKYSKKLEDAAGIIVGDFSKCDNQYDREYKIDELLKDIFRNFDKPVMYNIKSGHCIPMATIPFGINCIMNTEDKSIKFIKPLEM